MLFSIIQFFIRLGCGRHSPDTSSFPVYLQYSTNAGVNWNSIEQFDFNKYSNVPKYYALHVPPEARTNSTRVRWWQPSVNGTFPEEWAIDQVLNFCDFKIRLYYAMVVRLKVIYFIPLGLTQRYKVSLVLDNKVFD